MALIQHVDVSPSPKAAPPKAQAFVLNRWAVGLAMFAGVTLLVFLRAATERSMMHEHGPDAQMGIWIMFMIVKLTLWLLCGVMAAALLLLMWRSRWGWRAATVLFAVWGVWICVSSWQYLSARNALADASNSSTVASRLQELVHFDGIQAGYELDNRIAIHPNTSPQSLRELHQRGHLGTQMNLARNPNTPEDILQVLAKHEDTHVRGNLGWNPKLPASVRQQRDSTADKETASEAAVIDAFDPAR